MRGVSEILSVLLLTLIVMGLGLLVYTSTQELLYSYEEDLMPPKTAPPPRVVQASLTTPFTWRVILVNNSD
ncbi:MAG: hypothetical protein GXO00_02955, partial [Candidatus Diapherotrites archaeon]|nr:hypothetical protein [Candidatus Diapherotrites archaeon]